MVRDLPLQVPHTQWLEWIDALVAWKDPPSPPGSMRTRPTRVQTTLAADGPCCPRCDLEQLGTAGGQGASAFRDVACGSRQSTSKGQSQALSSRIMPSITSGFASCGCLSPSPRRGGSGCRGHQRPKAGPTERIGCRRLPGHAPDLRRLPARSPRACRCVVSSGVGSRRPPAPHRPPAFVSTSPSGSTVAAGVPVPDAYQPVDEVHRL
jgi:hypothetical protein